MSSALTQVRLLPLVGEDCAAHGPCASIVGKITRPVFLLNQERIRGIHRIACSYAYRDPLSGSIVAKVYQRSALVHVDACPHARIAVPEQLFLGAVQDIDPRSAFRLVVALLSTVIVGKFRHSHIDQFTALLQLPVISQSVFIGLSEKIIRRLPAAHFIQPARADKHHIVGITVIVLRQIPVLIHQVVIIRKLPGLRIIDHSAQYILRMGPEVGSVPIIACEQISRQMRDSHDPAVLLRAGRRCMGILLRRDPGCPRPTVHKGVPGIVAGMIRLRSFFPAGCHCTFYGRIGRLDVIDQVSIQIIAARGLGPEAKLLMEHAEDIIHDRFLILHGEHPDAEFSCVILLPELRAWKSQKRQPDLITVLRMMLFGQRHGFV